MNTTHRGIIRLLKNAVMGERVQLPDDFMLEEACRIMSNQGVIAMGYQGAIHGGLPKDMPLMRKLMQLYYQQMLTSERQMRALQQLFEAFEANGIDYMPVKGCNMKQLYPKPELRSMGDADILIRVEQLEQIAPLMRSMGFSLSLESEHTDNWSKPELYVELHKSLVPVEDEDYYGYYGTGWHLAQKGQGHRYDLSPEDSFLFLFTHFARHYRQSGIGCRHVVDLFVFRKANPCLDEAYIRREMGKLQLLEFYENMLRLLDVWFLEAEADEITDLMTAFVFSGGVWGTMEAELYAHQLRSAAQKGKGPAARGAFFRALFPPYTTIRNRYPILRRFPVLLPVMWVVRWFDVLLFAPKKMKKKLRILKGMDENQILTHQNALRAVGLYENGIENG